jgi:hypothetical protein
VRELGSVTHLSRTCAELPGTVLSMRWGDHRFAGKGDDAYHQDVIGAEVFPLVVEFCGLGLSGLPV